jgi:integrase
MGLYRRGKIYWLKFQAQGREVRISTGCRTLRQARKVEARIRDQITVGNWGILERETAPTVAEFIGKQFVPWASIHYTNANTRANYLLGARQLLASNMASVPLDRITSEHTTRYAADHKGWTAGGINQALRTLRRALSLALEWGKIASKPAVHTLPEARRERVLTEDEETRYLTACPEPWRTIALIMLDCACRPDEVMRLQWGDVDLARRTLVVRQGKTPAARRTLMLSGRIIDSLEALARIYPHLADQQIWPGRRPGGHVSQSKLWNQHKAALTASRVLEFDPYSLRHTCLTRLGEFVPLPTLKVIAGHSSISMTERYVHPAQASVEAAFAEAEQRRTRKGMRIVRKGKS